MTGGLRYEGGRIVTKEELTLEVIERLKKEYPDVYAACIKPSESRRFSVNEIK